MSYYRADPGLFGHEQAIVGWTTPEEYEDRRQPKDRNDYDPLADDIAPYCSGPGGLYQPDPDNYDRTPGDLLVKIEECPDCIGLIRNHHNHRIIRIIKEKE